MQKLLRIDASSRTANSYSRLLADEFINHWKQRHPDGQVTVRDITNDPINHISDMTIQGFYTAPDEMDAALKGATILSDQLIDELQDCDVLLISTPMYNFSIPSALKAWIDQIVRINKTFSYDGESFTGLLRPGKKAYIINAYGGAGYTDNGPFASANFLEPYLKFLVNFLGIDDIETLFIEATTADEAVVGLNMSNAKSDIRKIFEA